MRKGMNIFIVAGVWALIFALPLNGRNYSAGLGLGYQGGTNIQVSGTISDFAKDFPFRIQLAIGRTWLNPGSAADARRIFINDATNGDPQKSGRIYDFRMDFLYPFTKYNLRRTFLYAGPRYAMFTGNFKYIGGNEDFDITSKQWGLGLGIKRWFAISKKIDFGINAGIDYFAGSTLSGHDTAYSPDGEHVNPRNDYTYDDADDAVNQPKFEFKLIFEFNYIL